MSIDPTPALARQRRAAISRRIEQASLAPPETKLAAARAAFARLDSRAQWCLASEIARTREAEFTRWIRNVVAVACGPRQRRDAAGRQHLHPEPCVVFLVRGKWKAAPTQRQAGQALPTELLGYAELDGRRVMCAVPCDVQRQDRLLDVRAQSPSAVLATPPGQKGEFGSLACIAEDPAGHRYALAPIHVLTPRPDPFSGAPEVGARIWRVMNKAQRPPDSAVCARATVFGGSLCPTAEQCFDVQLARISDPARVAQALAGLNLSPTQPMVNNEEELFALLENHHAFIVVPENHPKFSGKRAPIEIKKSLHEHLVFPSYTFSGEQDSNVPHMALELALLDDQRTVPGDSGCPVVLELEQNVNCLIGMHIAASETSGNAYVIPAWRLFETGEYLSVQGRLPPGGIDLVAG